MGFQRRTPREGESINAFLARQRPEAFPLWDADLARRRLEAAKDRLDWAMPGDVGAGRELLDAIAVAEDWGVIGRHRNPNGTGKRP
jgi:hypothetical protein